jgi:hypothetical protein
MSADAEQEERTKAKSVTATELLLHLISIESIMWSRWCGIIVRAHRVTRFPQSYALVIRTV